MTNEKQRLAVKKTRLIINLSKKYCTYFFLQSKHEENIIAKEGLQTDLKAIYFTKEYKHAREISKGDFKRYFSSLSACLMPVDSTFAC